ncbi:MAG: T9SS type A sorting domain-containing protein [Fibrobacteres bacterium]|nr:T9SS type A sorting domain-containing protein [Fibrobacterota bacterium]
MKVKIILLLFLGVYINAAVTFVKEPSLKKISATEWHIEFELSEATDVAISIINSGNSQVIRNIAGGVLGANPPLPLQANSLRQLLTWNGRNNFGELVSLPDSLISLRVRAGMTLKMNALIENDYYMFAALNGIKALPDGSFILAAGTMPTMGAGGYSGKGMALRKYDAAGKYNNTIFPPPANLNSSDVAGYSPVSFLDRSWSLKTKIPTLGIQSFSVAASSDDKVGDYQLIGSGDTSEVLIADKTTIQTLFTNGAALPPLAITPQIVKSVGGPCYYTASHNSRYIYVSGRYTYSGTFSAPVLADTGFWKDGQVLKVDKLTGVATPWLSLAGVPLTMAARAAKIGSSPFFSAIHGVDIDDSGHVFVCDRLNGRIAVYDTNAVLIDSVQVDFPEAVQVNRKTGALYVVTRSDLSTYNNVYLKRFATWKNSPVSAESIIIASSVKSHNNRAFISIVNKGATQEIMVGTTGGLWLSNGTSELVLKIFTDAAGVLTYVKDFMTPAKPYELVNFHRVAVDRTTEVLYIQDGQTGIYKIDDWNNPKVVRCSTSLKKPLLADDMAVSPRGVLYVHEPRTSGTTTYFDGPVKRYSQGKYLTPLPYANTADNIVTPYYALNDVGNPTLGMDVSPVDNSVVCMYRTLKMTPPKIMAFADSGSKDTLKGLLLANQLTTNSGGMKVDLEGNIYFGVRTRSIDHVIPDGYVDDPAYVAVGAVVKYKAGTLVPDMSPLNKIHSQYFYQPLTGSERVYKEGYGAFGISMNISNNCICRIPRFELDYYGRLFIPNSITKRVAVVDNNGNMIVEFGGYGNVDSRGGLVGPGQTVSSPDFPLMYPIGTAASDEYIYVADMTNFRLMRIKMNYNLDVVSSSTGGNTSTAGYFSQNSDKLQASLFPNPFNPVTVINVTSKQQAGIDIKIYDCRGICVKTLAGNTDKSGRLKINWNGTNDKGRTISSGIYTVYIKAGNQKSAMKVIYSR